MGTLCGTENTALFPQGGDFLGIRANVGIGLQRQSGSARKGKAKLQ